MQRGNMVTHGGDERGGDSFIYALGEYQQFCNRVVNSWVSYHECAPLLPGNEDRLDSSSDCLGF